ncbi:MULTISPECIES: hypothetical protein [Dyella]|uniref:Lipoprotein n=2 Tax=Dyella TaxID=231454 RepID=A0A4R0YS75_9GAMM|nr:MULTISPECIES: hypothetical protein [Dyella]TBR40356.1 hypothetical protein EYV96_09395 [Dyella terrae]TCI12062.1 hypothetical protein EZM97_01475 [Dyella soli]
MTYKRYLAVLFLASLAGCQHPDNDQAAAPSTGAGTAPKSSSGLTVSPDHLAACEPGAVTSITWDASAAGVATEAVEVWVGSTLEGAKLFAAGGAIGEARTGPWTHPGLHFFLKNKSDGKVLADATVGGPSCP